MENFDPTQPSQGLGDTIAKITHYTGISKLTEVITEALGIEDCGCNRRRENLNTSISYETPQLNLEGEYKVLKKILLKTEQDSYTFDVGEIIYIDKEHLLYNTLSHYLFIGALIKNLT
jgi:hypothetical protein